MNPAGELIKYKYKCARGHYAYLELEGVWIFLPIIGAINTRRTVGGIKSDTVCRCERPATNIEDARGLVWKDNGGGAEHVRLDMHLTPSMVKIVDEAQVEFVSATRVLVLRSTTFLEEGHFAIYTERGKQRGYKAGDEVLHGITR